MCNRSPINRSDYVPTTSSDLSTDRANLCFSYQALIVSSCNTKNDIQVRSLVYDNILTFNLDHLKLLVGSEKKAKQMDLLDKNQYLIKEMLAYLGDPLKQTTCLFIIYFDDGDSI